MALECGVPPSPAREHQGAQLRYDALISLVARWNRVSTVEEAARAMVAGVKFVLSLDAWRFVLAEDDDERPVIVEGTLVHTSVRQAPIEALSPFERALFASGAPRMYDEHALAEHAAELPPSLSASRLRSLYGTASPGPSGRTEHVLSIGSAHQPLTALDLKFAGLIAGLFADKVRQLRAAERLRWAYQDLAERDSRIHADLVESRDFQRSLLPAPEPVVGLEIATVFEPAEMVGGDVYDLAVLPDGRLRLFLVDATGHGLQAALRTMVLLSEYNGLKYRAPTPGHLLRALNKRLFRHRTPIELLSPAVCADIYIEGDHHVCAIANAGAPPTIIANATGGRILEQGRSMLLGMLPSILVEEISTQLGTGDRLLFATDGLYDQRNPSKKTQPHEPYLRALAAARNIPECVAAVRAVFDHHRDGAVRDDDVTAVFVGVVPQAGNE